MATILLIIIYIIFIGLGIPDSLFGAAWPAIYTEFGVSVGMASIVTAIISCATIVSSLLSARLNIRFGTAKITAISTGITALALFGFSHSNHIVWMCILAIPLGLGAGAIDSSLNHYVALHYKAVHMNFMHCFYGIGVSLSPYLMSVALSVDSNWRKGYQMVSFIQFAITLLAFFSLPLWKKVKSPFVVEEKEKQKVIGITTLLKQKKVLMVCSIFFGSCAAEYVCGIWGSTFLVEAKNVEIDLAAKVVTLYYIGMALGRFLSGIFSNKLTSWQLIKIGQGITIFGVFFLLYPMPAKVSAIALFLIGFGNSIIFPNMLHLTPKNFGIEVSQSVMGIQMTASYLGIMLAPALFGVLAQGIGVSIFPYYIAILFGIMFIGTIFWRKEE